MRLLYLLTLICGLSAHIYGQILPYEKVVSATEKQYQFTSLKLALEQPEKVFKLKLRGHADRIAGYQDRILLHRDSVAHYDTLSIPNKAAFLAYHKERISFYEQSILDNDLDSLVKLTNLPNWILPKMAWYTYQMLPHYLICMFLICGKIACQQSCLYCGINSPQRIISSTKSS